MLLRPQAHEQDFCGKFLGKFLFAHVDEKKSGPIEGQVYFLRCHGLQARVRPFTYSLGHPHNQVYIMLHKMRLYASMIT